MAGRGNLLAAGPRMKQTKIVLVSVDDRLLHVQFTGAVKMEDFLLLFEEIRQLADAHQVKNILIDAHTFRKKVSSVQRLQVALALVEKFLGYRVAGVISVESFDPRLLAETMARNRGGNVKMTTSLAEALKWLGGRSARAGLPLAGAPRSH
jgi:hypothetical protein